MSSILSPGGRPVGPLGNDGIGQIQAPQGGVAQQVPQGGGQPVAAQGGLAGRQVAVGDGQQNEAGRSTLDKIKTGLLRVGQGLLAAVTLPVTLTAGAVLGLAALGKVIGEKITGQTAEQRNQAREAQAEQRYVQANQAMVTALRTPQGPTIADNAAVMDRLQAHAQLTGKNLSPQELRDMVVAGENIAKGLQDPANATGRSPLSLTLNGQQYDVPSNTLTARAVAWYMMASAASQDVARNVMGDTSTSDMTTSGSYVMKDPGNRIYNFLNDAPTAGTRMSTHFEERLGHDREHYLLGFIPTFGKKPEQRGIEDFQSRMPGQGGTMLFDKLRPDGNGTPELFVKFESAGCPPYFSSESHHGIGDKFMRFFASLDRNIHHCINFKHSQNQGQGEAPTTISRQEHMYKGTLEPTFEAVKTLFDDAIHAGVANADDASGIAKSMKKFGVSAGLQVAQSIAQRAADQQDPVLQAKALSVASMIESEMTRLGLASDHHGIARRGAEVHISLDPGRIMS